MYVSSSTKNCSLTMAPGRGLLCHNDISTFILPGEANILWWLIKRLSMSSVVTMGKPNWNTHTHAHTHIMQA